MKNSTLRNVFNNTGLEVATSAVQLQIPVVLGCVVVCVFVVLLVRKRFGFGRNHLTGSKISLEDIQAACLPTIMAPTIELLKFSNNQYVSSTWSNAEMVQGFEVGEGNLIQKQNGRIEPWCNLSKDLLCIVCHDRQPNAILVPCGHGGMCVECTTRWFQLESSTRQGCPLCRREICGVLRIVGPTDSYKILAQQVSLPLPSLPFPAAAVPISALPFPHLQVSVAPDAAMAPAPASIRDSPAQPAYADIALAAPPFSRSAVAASIIGRFAAT